jgi:hypothetical protein
MSPLDLRLIPQTTRKPLFTHKKILEPFPGRGI